MFQIHQWSRCWRLCIHQWNLLHPWFAFIQTNKYHTHGCRYVWTHWWCVCCTSRWWFEGTFLYENGNQRILQGRRYNNSHCCMCGKYPLRLLDFRQLLLMLCAYFSVNCCDECITPSHRTWCPLCEPCQNTRNYSWPYENWVLMWFVSSNTLG